MRHLLLVAAVLIATACNPTPPPPLETASYGAAPHLAPRVNVWLEGDTTLAVEVLYGYKGGVVPGGGAAESTLVQVSLYGDATPRYTQTKASTGADTARFSISTYGTIRGWGRVAPVRRGIVGAFSPQAAWQFIRPDAPPPAYDSVNVQPIAGLLILVRPAGLQVDPDPAGTCAAWQAANPAESPWLAVNVRAVPPCTSANDKPMVAQFCALACLPDTGCQHTTNHQLTTPDAQTYCDEQLAAVRAEREV